MSPDSRFSKNPQISRMRATLALQLGQDRDIFAVSAAKVAIPSHGASHGPARCLIFLQMRCLSSTSGEGLGTSRWTRRTGVLALAMPNANDS